ncbi:hypothetical protein V501_00402 [Pseudogymnoascus sp. VKM F-4519 (FW-2642)]|nr:hypothetical protein V501_00402 [Pseudogymnoascus sp. VKM F-4519 (FW-2642)]
MESRSDRSFLPIKAKTSGAVANCYSVAGNLTSLNVPASLLAEATMALDAASRSLSQLPARLKSAVKGPINQFLFLIYNLLFADIQQAIAFVLNIHALRHNAIEVCFHWRSRK